MSAMDKVAELLEMPPIKVYEVASFYTMFNRDPVGKHFVEVCTTTPCQLCGSDSIVDAVEEELGIKVGQTTDDGQFTVVEVECQGACANAPMVKIGDWFYEDLTPATVKKLLRDIKGGVEVTPGPQTADRVNCEPAGGQLTLTSKPRGPYAPYLQ